jgi:predicted nucleotide-binding protein
MSYLPATILNNFMRGARAQSQSEILKSFLRLLVFGSDISESGSVLVWHSVDGKLHLFNDHDFLFNEGFLDKKKQWKLVFDTWEGLAGLAYTTRALQYSNDVSKEKHYVKDTQPGDAADPIKSMVCLPIVLPGKTRPYGVVSFHNGSSGPPFEEEIRTVMEVAVNTLSFALATAEGLRSRKVFIVHGRDTSALDKLQLILVQRGIDPVVLGQKARVGGEILQKLDEILGDCCAGFVLLTPDDEGRLRSEAEHLNLRARQNVIFEAGWLTALFRIQRKICFLTTERLEIPSDLGGVLTQEFDVKNPNIAGIEGILTEWRIDWTRPQQ